MRDNRARHNAEQQTTPLSEVVPGGKSNDRCVELCSIISDISIEAVTRYFGGSRYKPDEATIKRVHDCIASSSTRIAPQATYTLFKVSRITAGKEIILETGARLSVPDCLEVAEAELVSVVIGTLGSELETHCRDLAAKGEIYLSILFDAIGTASLDLLSERMSEYIERTCASYGLVNGPRFAPGIDSYPLDHQHQLFELADGRSIGVTLNSSAIMMPTKSISFFQTLSKPGEIRRSTNKCQQCRLTGCQFRVTTHKDRIQHSL